MSKKVAIIGVGNCGSQVANLAEKKYGTLFDCIYINTSETDLSMVVTDNDDLKFKIGNKDEVEGSGKNRSKMKKYLKDDIQDIMSNQKLQETIVEKKYCYIIASAAGGTGSGAAPVLFDIIRQMFPDTYFVLVVVLQKEKASLMELGNSIEFLDELYNILGENVTYMVYDNQQTADLPVTESLTTVNENIVEDLRVLTGVDNYPTPYESIDVGDFESIITTPGRLIVARLYDTITEKSMEDNNLSDMIIKAIKRSCHCETDRNKKVGRWGIITYFTDAVNKLYSADLSKLEEFIGTPIEVFNHNAINKGNENMNFMYLVASGLSPINDRVAKIKDRIEMLSSSLPEAGANKYILADEGVSYSVMEERKKQIRRANQPAEININDSFAKFLKD